MTGATPDIVIGRCDLNITRPKGSAPLWLGKADHEALAARVRVLILSMLDELLARYVSEDGDDIAALSLDLNFTAADLQGAAPLARPSFRARLDAALAQAVGAAVPAGVASPSVHGGNLMPAPVSKDPELMPAHALDDNVVPRILRVLFAGGEVSRSAADLPIGALLDLLAAALRWIDSMPGLMEQAETIRSSTPVALRGLSGRRGLLKLLAELAVATEKVSGSDADAPDQANRAALRSLRMTAARYLAQQSELRRAHGMPDDLAPDGEASPETPPAIGATGPGKAGAASADMPAALENGRYDMAHLLPMLVLSSLARHGVLDAIAVDLLDHRDHLLASVAFKALPRATGPRPAQERAAIGAALGIATPPEGKDFAAVASGLRAPLARAVVAEALIGSLGPGVCVPLVIDAGLAILFDPAGLSPVVEGVAADIADLLAAPERPLFLAGASGDAFRALAALGLPIVGVGAPPRKSAAVQVTGHLGWVGHASPNAALPVAMRRRLAQEADIAGRAGEVWQALTRSSPLVAPAAATPQTDALDRLAALLAGFALADIGWSLAAGGADYWADPDPILVRDWFAGLSGYLDVTDDAVTAVLPMGRRFTDLRDAGALPETPGWGGWAGRRMTYRGG